MGWERTGLVGESFGWWAATEVGGSCLGRKCSGMEPHMLWKTSIKQNFLKT